MWKYCVALDDSILIKHLSALNNVPSMFYLIKFQFMSPMACFCSLKSMLKNPIVIIPEEVLLEDQRLY